MQKVTFTNSRGESIELYKEPFFLNKIEGLGDVDAEMQSQKSPGQDGSTLTSIVLAERYIPMEVYILNDAKVNRQKISRVFNPRLGEGVLTYDNGLVKRRIKAVSDHVPSFSDIRPRLYETVSIDLVCHNPYWLDALQVDQLVIWEGGLTFPLELPTEFATQSTDKKKLIKNTGDIDTPIEIVFNGPATSPIRVENVTTGKFLEVKQDLLSGEKLRINTTFGNKTVDKILSDGTVQNAFHSISVDSTFFNLIIGNNLIEYSTGADYERAGVSISYQHRYAGI